MDERNWFGKTISCTLWSWAAPCYLIPTSSRCTGKAFLRPLQRAAAALSSSPTAFWALFSFDAATWPMLADTCTFGSRTHPRPIHI
eukprot:3037288-Pleurochrysis_carterae.AAC.1